MSTDQRHDLRIAPAAPVVAFVAAAIVLLGLTTLPIGYYSFERWAVCAASVTGFVLAYRAGAGAWGVLFLPAAVVWTPFWPVYMTRTAWLPLDLLLAAGLIAFGFWSRQRTAVQRSQEDPQ